MDNLKIDLPRIGQMEIFFKYLHTLALKDEQLLDSNGIFVYNELCKTGLRKDNFSEENGGFINNEMLFDLWQDDYPFQEDAKIFVIRSIDFWNFLTFSSPNYFEMTRNYIKLYIPIEKNHLRVGVKRLFDYIIEERIIHMSKISNYIRSDNVVVRLRFTDVEAAKKIIDFVTHDSFLKGGLNETNPFVPTVNGIGFMYESGISYNKEMAILLSHYINFCVNLGIFPDMSDFYDWFKIYNCSSELSDIFCTLGVENAIHNCKALKRYDNL